MGSRHLETMVDAAAALERARDYLASDPVEHNVIWSIMSQRAESGAAGRYWLLEFDACPVGIVLESPPGHAAAISRMRDDYAIAMAEAICEAGHRLTGVAGEASTTAAFAGRWTECAGTAGTVEEAQRLYVLGRLAQPAGVLGSLRRAEPFERGFIIEWWSAFQIETGSPRFDVSGAVDAGLSARRLFVWDDGGARCVARATEPLGGISRIGAVFTPPRWRCRGYASACVGALCEWVRREEGATSVLYAQLGNPGSNAIYRRLGFAAVSEVLAYRFGDVVEHL
jgi:predicted GNAT family acetyltransferase